MQAIKNILLSLTEYFEKSSIKTQQLNTLGPTF
jgi:hypothetical protein